MEAPVGDGDGFGEEMEYVDAYENENIISKEHSYPSNEIIEFISFSEEAPIDDDPDEEYPLIDDEITITTNVEENDDEIIANQSSCEEQELCVEDIQANKSITEDLEVDAFFKTLAMKVKNAKLSQSLFTDLQIELLQTIQHRLKNS